MLIFLTCVTFGKFKSINFVIPLLSRRYICRCLIMTEHLLQPSDKRVLGLFNDSFPPIMDGVTLAVQNYAHWLKEAGHDVRVVTPRNPVQTESEVPVMRYFSLPIHNRHPYRYGYPRLDFSIWRRLRETPFSIVHAHCPFSSGRLAVYAKRQHGVPLIGTFHSKYRDDLRHSFHGPMSWMVGIIMRRILDFFNACDEVWIPQAEVEETVREYGYRGPLTVVENGNDYAGLSDAETSAFRKESRSQLGIGEDESALLFVGQHIFEKGTDIIVQALGRLGKDTRFRMDFIGTGYAAESLKAMTRELGIEDKVTFHGVVHDRELLRRHYAAADLFLFPSLYDNAPLVVREAAAMGTPSLLVEGATAAGVITDGINGFLTRRTPDDYARAIRSITTDRGAWKRVSVGARHSLVRSWQDIVCEVEDRYRVILSRYGR